MAATWYSLESRASASAGQWAQSQAAAKAAVYADVADADNLAALGLASIRINDYASIETLPALLLLQAPKSTNTWIVMGAWAAAQGRDDVASGSLDLAFKWSQNTRVTRAFMDKLAEQVRNPVVALALRDALRRNAAVDAGE
ncbi:hypothetical protein [Variovorax sp. GT1P44]|uniref:hypothetical protein n=1 Tax=Variovorax sp. GT1P44 TaxID=3443742 RepID=UPI003F451C9A